MGFIEQSLLDCDAYENPTQSWPFERQEFQRQDQSQNQRKHSQRSQSRSSIAVHFRSVGVALSHGRQKCGRKLA
jgi:hypothetical protein